MPTVKLGFTVLFLSLNWHPHTTALIFRDDKCNFTGNHRRSNSSKTDAILYWIAMLPANVIKISTEFDFNLWSDPVIFIQSSYQKLK